MRIGASRGQPQNSDHWPPPSEPLSTARRIVDEWFPQGFAHWRGDFYAFESTHWKELERDDLEAACYLSLEAVTCTGANRNVQRWNPTKHKVSDVLDAAKSLNHLPRHLDPPFWLTDGSASDLDSIVMRNGLLHLPTRTMRPHPRDRIAPCII